MVETRRELPLAPVGSRPSQQEGSTAAAISAPRSRPGPDETVSALASFGLGSKKPNIQIRQSFQVDRPPAEVWRFFADIEGVAACLPGARLNGPPVDGHVRGQFTAKLGPIAASFSGEARIERNDETHSGVILGGGQDARAGSRASGEIEYRLSALDAGAATQVDLEIRALIAGPLAQFGRSGIVEDLTRRIVDVFSRNIEAVLSGDGDRVVPDTSLQAGSLLKDLVKARLLALLEPILRMFRSRE
jgi:carbon-monoxide dehydrogenase small subunit